MKIRRWKRELAVSLVVVSAICLFAGCGGGSGSGSNQGPAGRFVYTETNAATAGGNAIQAYSQDSVTGKLTLLGSYATGGMGTSEPALLPTGVLDTDRAVIANSSRTLLYAVNQGSDTIAVMRINSDGSLTPIAGSPFASGGHAPVSLGFSRNETVLTVVNSSLDPGRNVSDIAPNYTNFTVASSGSLSPVAGSTITLTAGAAATAFGSAPSIALPSPDGTLIFGSNFLGDRIPVFQVGANGSLTQSPGSPFVPDASIFTGAAAGKPQHPFGVVALPSSTKRVLYVSYPLAQQLAVYNYDSSGTLTFVKAVSNQGKAACWLLTNAAGTRLYSTNAVSGDVSVYDISDPLSPTQIQLLPLTNQAGAGLFTGNPWHEALDPTGAYLYILTPRDLGSTPSGQGNTMHVLKIDATTGMATEVAGSLVNLNVPLGTNPQGLLAL